MSDRDRSELERVAYHEAGHAVAAYRLCRATGPVTIVPTKARPWLLKKDSMAR